MNPTLRTIAPCILVLATACGTGPDPNDPRVKAERARLDRENQCSEIARKIFNLDTERTVAMTDQAIAEGAASADTQYAQTEYRHMMEGEMGLAPGQGQGWREVYKNRAKVEATMQERYTAEIDQLQKQLDTRCKDVSYSRF